MCFEVFRSVVGKVLVRNPPSVLSQVIHGTALSFEFWTGAKLDQIGFDGAGRRLFKEGVHWGKAHPGTHPAGIALYIWEGVIDVHNYVVRSFLNW